MTAVSYIRQSAILDPNKAKDTSITICGCGTVGSNVAVQLAKAGFGKFYLCDMDTVEPHNIPSQAFEIDQLGENKAKMTRANVMQVSSIAKTSIKTDELVGGEAFETDIVVLAVDSIDMRKKIYEMSIKNNPMVKAFMDFRMGGNLLQAWFVMTDNDEQMRKYEDTFFDAKDAVDLGCGGRTFAPIGALSGAVATCLLTKFVSYPWVETEDQPAFYTYLDMAAFELQVAG